MKILHLLFLFLCQISLAQVVLSADGPGNTYELINNILAPGYDVVEVPDCVHTSFGRHIEEVWDEELNKYVFKFHIHVSPDNDRCIKFDRQRNEIKTYNQSPDNLIGTYGEKVVYKWKFKLDEKFQASNKFTHIHQIKAYGGLHESIPVISLIPRGGSNPKLQVMHSDSITAVEVASASLSLFRGIWVEATETITYAQDGKYEIILKRISDNAILINYSNNNIRTWRDNAIGIRPKWGIYRSLLNTSQLRDEEVLFADFSIEEINPILNSSSVKKQKISLFPNPISNGKLFISADNNRKEVIIYSSSGEQILNIKTISESINVSHLSKGIYVLKITEGGRTQTQKLIVN
jgi:predicted  nucleic acid-binding Zn-ribbon protein